MEELLKESISKVGIQNTAELIKKETQVFPMLLFRSIFGIWWHFILMSVLDIGFAACPNNFYNTIKIFNY